VMGRNEKGAFSGGSFFIRFAKRKRVAGPRWLGSGDLNLQGVTQGGAKEKVMLTLAAKERGRL